MKKLLLILLSLSTYIGFSQCMDPQLTDFECATPSHPINGALQSIANTFSGGINTSATIGEYTDDGTAPFDALTSDYGMPIDLDSNPIFHIKVYTELDTSTPIPLAVKVENGGTPLEISTTINVSNTWTEYTFDFSTVAGTGNTRLAIFFNITNTDGTTMDKYYIDDLFFGPAPTQCEDPLLTDFECDIPAHPLVGAIEKITNPFVTGINTSDHVGRYTDNGTEAFDAFTSNYGMAIDLNTNPIFHVKVYTELNTNTPIPLTAKVENGGTPLEITSMIDVSNVWKEYTFDFSSVAGTGNMQLSLFFNFNQTNGTTTDIYFIDDLFFGPPPTQCEDPLLTDFECDLPSYPFSGGVPVTTVPNPSITGINTSANVGQAIDDGTQPFDALIVEYGSPIDLTTTPIFTIKVYTELTTPIPFVAKVEGGTTPLEISTTINTSNEWTEYTFDFSSVANSGNTRLVIFFNFNQSDGTTSDVYYIDDMFFGTTLVNEFTYVDDTTGWTPNNPTDINNPSTQNDNVFIRSGTANLTNDITAKNIIIDEGAILNAQGVNVFSALSSAGTTDIFGILTPNASQINTSGRLSLKSNELGTAVVADASMATFNDDVTVERYIPASNRAFRLLSTSVQNAGSISSNWQNNTHITGVGGNTNGFDQTVTNASSMFYVNEQGLPANYEAITSTTGTMLEHGTGYLVFIRGDRTIDLTNNDATPTATTLSSTGVLFQGSYSLGPNELNRGDFNAGGNGSSLIANPYQAPVNMEQVLNSSTEINQEFIHVYDPSLGERGAFVSVGFGTQNDGSGDITNFTSGTNAANDASPTTATRFMQPGGAVFVNTIDAGIDGNASPSITFNEVDKALEFVSSGPFRAPTAAEPENKHINILLYTSESFVNNQTPQDGLTVRFGEQYTNSIETTDALKATNLDENFSSIVDGKAFSIQSRSLPVIDETIDLSIDTYRSNNYTLKVTVSEFENVSTFLIDRHLGTETLLGNNSDTILSFAIDLTQESTVASDRFSIVFRDNVLGINENEESSFSLFPNPVNDGILFIRLKNLESTDNNIIVSTLLGQKVLTQSLDDKLQNQNIDVTSLSNGVYIVGLKANKKITTQLLIIQ